MKKNILKSLAALLLMGAIFSGCVEERYYRHNNHHSSGYYERRQMIVPVGIEFEIHK